MNIFETCKIKSIAKGTILLRQGEICKIGFKVITGCLKSYVLDDTGKEHIMQFAPEGWIITDMNSLFNNVPSDIIIEAIEDSEVYWIESEMLNIWGNASKEVLIEQIKMLRRNIITANKRTRMLLSSTSEERYNDFIQTYPSLTQRLPLKLIAAYIGITPEYLSEIRRKVACK
ncbi:MAG: Crp/Fnr family transcriptional regulator [Bacteroidota bacterium]